MNAPATDPSASPTALVLLTTPPRLPRQLQVRTRLAQDSARLRDAAVIVVQAPSGFGKTSLMSQWRRECLAQGAAVAWVTADASDDGRKFLHCLVHAVRHGCGRPGFGQHLLDGVGLPSSQLEGITAWLVEVGHSALDIVLMVDDAERLAPANAYALTYLLHNGPPNLRIVVGARGGMDEAVADLVGYGQCLLLGPDDLRFGLDETIALLRGRFADAIDADAAARLHEATEGWPLGLQAAMAAMARAPDPAAALRALAAGALGTGASALSGLLAGLAPDDLDFLARVAFADLLHPELCAALLGDEQAGARLGRLARETPFFSGVADGPWLRLHNLVRETLRARFGALPDTERAALHGRAHEWFAAQGLDHEAARHALVAGRHEAAYDLAERSLFEAVTQGQQAAMLGWLEVLPADELQKRPRLRLAAAWALALSERHADALALIGDLAANPAADRAADAEQRFECALIASGAAYYADDPDRCVELFAPWQGNPPARDARLAAMRTNRLAVLALLSGDPVQARRQLQASGGAVDGYRYGARWGHFFLGLTYVWEGQYQLGEAALRPALASNDADLGRRHQLSCMCAALLATIAYEGDRIEVAAELLANRLDVLERVGTPETILLAYRTAARIAALQGVEHRALDLLESLYAVGVARGLPRLCVASMAEQVRLHAARSRNETCAALVERIDAMIQAEQGARGPLWQKGLRLLQDQAHASAALGRRDWAGALTALARVGAEADAIHMGRLRIEAMALRALAQEKLDGSGAPLLREALNLARTYGLSRLFVDAHPELGDWLQHSAEAADLGAAKPSTARPPVRPAGTPRAVPSMVLTPKERVVLEHLARNLSNKEIAQAMEVGEETVKWHLKNLFGKLDAGTRKHVVRRAQLLGLLEGLE